MCAQVKLDLSGVKPLHVVLTDKDIWATRIVPLICGDGGCMILTDRERTFEEMSALCDVMQTSDLSVEIVPSDELTAFIRQHYPQAEAMDYVFNKGPEILREALEAEMD
jgi:hypothetical protein